MTLWLRTSVIALNLALATSGLMGCGNKGAKPAAQASAPSNPAVAGALAQSSVITGDADSSSIYLMLLSSTIDSLNMQLVIPPALYGKSFSVQQMAPGSTGSQTVVTNPGLSPAGTPAGGANPWSLFLAFPVNNLAPNSLSCFHVLFGDAMVSQQITCAATLPDGTTTPPAAPSALTISNPNLSDLRLTWTSNSTDETGFSIERLPGNVTAADAWTPWEDTIAIVPAGTTTYSDASAQGGTYTYRVRATNAGGNSGSVTASGSRQPAN